MSYNLTAVSTNATTLLGFTQGVNTYLLDGFLGFMFLTGVFIILMIAFTRITDSASKSATVASFIVAVLCFILRIINLVSDKMLFGFVVLSAATVAITWKK